MEKPLHSKGLQKESSEGRVFDFENDKKTFQRNRDDKKGKSDRKCFRCGDPNHLIGECPKPPKDKNQRAIAEGSMSDIGETRLMKKAKGREHVSYHKHMIRNVLNPLTLEKTFLECPSKGTNDGKKRDSFYQDQGAGKKEQNQNCEQEAKILAYTLAVKKLDAQIITFQKQQLSLNEQLTFQANEIYAKDEKLKRYRRIGMKACTLEDYINKPLYSRFTKTNSFKGVPHPLTGDYTPKPHEEIDDSLYVYGKKGSQKPEVSDSDDNSTEHSTCQSNDSKGSCGNTSEHSSESEVESISVPNEMSTSKSVITNEKVMSESKEVEPSCAKHVKTPRQQMKNQGTSEVKGKNWNKMMERELGEGYSFIKKKCFVCGSLSHLIKDCDYYEKKMAREAEFKKQRVFNTGNRVAKPVWTNANRVNHANHFVPRPVQLNAVRQNVNSVRPNVNTGRVNVNSVRHNVNSVRTNVNTGRSKQPVPTCNSNSFSPVRPQGTAVKTSAGYNWRNSRPNSNCDSEPTFIRTMNAKGHMTGNKDYMDDFEEYKGGSVTFRGSKGYITGKGRIRVGNLDFDSVSFVKELEHFNLFSISQICDKQHKVLFTETECLVVSPEFKMLDENQILLKVPRKHNMYSFDMKIPSLIKDYACLIAKATFEESKLWHRRLIWRRNGRDYGLATKIHQEVLFSERGDGVAGIKRRRRDLSGDGVWILATTSKTSANLS
ncbi:ribonuclease H-like domain-containing protein [Tanacetum coccineum]